MKYQSGECSICLVPSDELMHFPLYVMSSKGVWCCPSCQIALGQLAKEMKSTAIRKNLCEKGNKDATYRS